MPPTVSVVVAEVVRADPVVPTIPVVQVPQDKATTEATVFQDHTVVVGVEVLVVPQLMVPLIMVVLVVLDC